MRCIFYDFPLWDSIVELRGTIFGKTSVISHEIVEPINGLFKITSYETF